MKLTFIGLMIIAAIASASVDTPHQAAALVLDQMLDGNIEGRSVLSYPGQVYEGEPIATWNEDVVAPFAGFLVLIDDAALANWEHPCRWVFVSPEGTTQSFHMTTPPNALPRMSMEYSSLPEHSSVRSDILDWFVPNPRQTDADNCKALIVSGGANSGNNHIRYYGDVQFLYLTLTQDYGYTNDDIIICFADGLNPAPDQSGGLNSDPDLDGDGEDDFDYDATLGSVTNAMAEMAALAGPSDHVLYLTTDHGGNGKFSNSPPEVYLNLWNSQTLNDDMFDTFIDTFDCASLHVVMEQCFSGGFMEETVPAPGQEPRTFASAANASESSWAGATYPEYDEWCYWWTGAMHGSVPPGGSYPGGALPYDPDINMDGFVDYGEAFDASLAWDSYAQSGQEHPQYDDYPDSCGSDYWLGGYISTPGIEEGYGPALPSGNLAILGNPVPSSATVSFSLGVTGNVDISVFDLTGRVVDTLVSGEFASGSHTVAWDTRPLASGIYVVRMSSGGVVETLRAVKF